MKAFLDHIFAKSRTVLLLFVFSIIAGLSAYINVPKESTPDVKIPIIHISVRHDGISPKDAETLIARPIEQEVKSIEGIKDMQSTCYEGGANVVLEFFAGFDTSKALQDVRDKVDQAKSKLPRDAKDPKIREVNMSLFPILIVKLSGKIPKRTLFTLARDLADAIEADVPTVLKAELSGTREDLLEILIPPSSLQHLTIQPDMLLQNLSRNNQVISAGAIELEQGNFNIKVPGLVESWEDLQKLPLAHDKDALFKFEDIANIRRSFKDPKVVAFDRVSLDHSEPTVAIEISKRTGENLIETVANIKKVTHALQQQWPKSVQVSFAQDESDKIRDMLSELQNGILLAVILVTLVILSSLGWRSSLLVGLAVPGAFLMGIWFVTLMGYTVNIVVLFSLIFSIGMLVDGAIIVVEYADKLMAEGETSVRKAYITASKRMLWPVITSISTILVVFLPLLFWPGVVGQFMKFMPITLLAVLSSSILMALVFVPVISAFQTKPKHITIHKDTITDKGFLGWYLKKLNYALDFPKRIIGGAVLILICIKILHSFFGRGVEFFPDIEPNSTIFYVHARGNLSLSEKETLVRNVENTMLDMTELSSVYTRIGSQSQSKGQQIAEDTIGSITIEFINWKYRRKANAIIADILHRAKRVNGVIVEARKNKPGPPPVKPIQMEISSIYTKKIEPAVKRILNILNTDPQIIGVEDTLDIPAIEWNMAIDREQAAKFGVDVTSLGKTVQFLTTGAKIGTYRPEDVRDEVDIVVRYPKEFRSLEYINMLSIPTQNGPIPVTNVMRMTPIQKTGKIHRANGNRIMTIKADVAAGALVADKIQDIRDGISDMKLDQDIHITFKGEEKDRKESVTFLMKAFMVALFFVLLILVTQFNSFFHAGLILSAVVLSTAGVFVGLMIHNLSFGIVMGGIGVIALSGIIVSNNIILIDTYVLLLNALKSKKSAPKLADIRNIIMETCAQRLRPVLLTKATTILGLLPIMFGIDIDFFNLSISQGAPSTQWWVLLSTCIVYGALFASSLTLFVTPAALMWKATSRLNKGKTI